MFENLVKFIREIYGTNDFIPLHEPRFNNHEKKYVLDTINSTFVSSVGKYVDDFENNIAEFTGSNFAVATVNGTSALHLALILAGVKANDEVLTQSFTFVATSNAIRYCNAEPVFLDIDRNTLGLSANSLENFLQGHCELRDDGNCWNKSTNRIVRACVPMHTFGFPIELTRINSLCEKYNIFLVEDAAESLGSFYNNKHTGTIGKLSALSFNGNKIITTGGGGMILSSDKDLATRAKHISTTAKLPHQWAFEHDQVGYNYRMPNLNAALGVAQLESLPGFLQNKRKLASMYQEWGAENGLVFTKEHGNAKANYWLNAIITDDIKQRDMLLEYTNSQGVMTRPAWTPMHQLDMNKNCLVYDLKNTQWAFERIVNVPSSVTKV